MTTRKTSPKESSSHALAIGAGLAAVAAAAAGTYYLYGPKKGAQHRKAIKSWTLKMKADVMDEIEQLKDLNEDLYKSAVAKVAEKYKTIKDIDSTEVFALAQRMQGHWKDIKKDINAGVKSIKKSPKKKMSSIKKSRA